MTKNLQSRCYKGVLQQMKTYDTYILCIILEILRNSQGNNKIFQMSRSDSRESGKCEKVNGSHKDKIVEKVTPVKQGLLGVLQHPYFFDQVQDNPITIKKYIFLFPNWVFRTKQSSARGRFTRHGESKLLVNNDNIALHTNEFEFF